MTTIRYSHQPGDPLVDDAPLTLTAHVAAQLMTARPVTIGPSATMREAAHTLMEARVSALPVIDGEGVMLGVLSQSDIVRHERERDDCVEQDVRDAANARLGRKVREHLGEGYHIELNDSPLVSELMTPLVFAVQPDTSARKVIEIMLENKIHRVFVVDRANRLLGVVSTVDVLRRLVI